MRVTENGNTRIVPDFDNKKTVDVNGVEIELDTVYITGAGYIKYPFYGITADSPLGFEEPVWGGNLTRSTDFVLTNIDTVKFGLVGRCEFNIKYMDMKDYMVLCEMTKERFVTVDYYNRQRNERVVQEMSFTGNEMKKIYAMRGVVGMLDVSVKLVATNREKADLVKNVFKVTFNNSGGSGSIDTMSINYSDVCDLPDGSAFSKSGHRLLYWATKNTDGTYFRFYNLGQSVTVWEDLKLYAVWEAV